MDSEMLDMNENGGSSTTLASFITTLYDMVDDLSSDSIISWSMSGKSFIIWNPEEFYRDLLQKFNKKKNSDFFFWDLDILSFRKIDSGKWEFANDDFVRGQPHLIKNIINMRKQRVQLYQRNETMNVRRLFSLQAKDVENSLQPHMCSHISEDNFLTKTYEMVDDPSSDAIISWSQSGKSFIIWNPQEFYRSHLSKFYRALHIAIFFNKLKNFDFIKINPEKWEFANDNFVRGQPHLMEIIRSTHKEKMEQLRQKYARQKIMSEARELFKLQVKELLAMRKAARKKMKKAKQVKELEVQLQHVGLCKL